jgi:SSS family solute:Na+ symporter
MFKLGWPALPFMDRVGIVFLLTLSAAVAVSLLWPQPEQRSPVSLEGVRYATPAVFNLASTGVVVILIALYATWW